MFSELNLNIYGVSIKISSELEMIQSWIRFDFAKFLADSDAKSPPNISAFVSRSPLELPDALSESSRGTGHVCFDAGTHRYVLYSGVVLAVFDRSKESVTFSGDNTELLYEKLFLFILSRAGEILEHRGLHRVHGLGFSNGSEGFLYLMPMGGGKSTLGLELSSKNFKLISDDTPLVDYKGNLLPFPLRIGGVTEDCNVPPLMKRVFIRSAREPKLVLHPDALGDIWESKAVKCRAVILGRWTTSKTVSLRKVSRFQIGKKLLRDCVVGYGVAQVLEFFIQSTWGDIFSKIGLVFRRSLAVISIVRNAQGYELFVPCNPQSSVSDLLASQFLKVKDS